MAEVPDERAHQRRVDAVQVPVRDLGEEIERPAACFRQVPSEPLGQQVSPSTGQCLGFVVTHEGGVLV